MKILKKIKAHKEKNFSSWLEFVLALGTVPFSEGGYLIFIYSWGGAIAMLCMYFMLKYGLK